MIKVRIEKDSIGPNNKRITTFVLKYPRMIHSELMTHRVFSRNASSSRAIPVEKLIQDVLDEPVIPMAFLKNKKGMQGGEALSSTDQLKARLVWLQGRDEAVKTAEDLVKLGIHKQHANRVLEPYSHIHVVLTATEFANWFGLRYHGMAQPEICELAKQMWELYRQRAVDFLEPGEWHLPFIRYSDMERSLNENLIRSVASCARVSYKNHDKTTPTLSEDLALYNRLVGSQPIHASPTEHQAMATGDPSVRSGNFIGWIQHRKTILGENIKTFDGPEKIG